MKRILILISLFMMFFTSSLFSKDSEDKYAVRIAPSIGIMYEGFIVMGQKIDLLYSGYMLGIKHYMGQDFSDAYKGETYRFSLGKELFEYKYGTLIPEIGIAINHMITIDHYNEKEVDTNYNFFAEIELLLRYKMVYASGIFMVFKDTNKVSRYGSDPDFGILLSLGANFTF